MERWCRESQTSFENYSKENDYKLWEETKAYSKSLEKNLKKQYNGLGTTNFNENVSGGGSAAYGLLYFMTRYIKPVTAVETGVAAGWSSRAILDGMQKNGQGELYSNDLHYSDREREYNEDRIEKDEVGILVKDELKDRWNLSLGTDKNNLPEIVESVDSIDLFHYDSDKSYSGRSFALSEVNRKLHDDSVIIMDDIEDNLFFRDFVRKQDVVYDVIRPNRKAVGIIYGTW